jgi:predicted PurR-regulated permease PerM
MTLVAVAVAGLTLWHFGLPLLLASWVALLARPWMARMTTLMRGRSRGAAVLTTLLVLLILVPLIAALIPLIFSLIAVASDAQGTGQWQGAARRYLQGHEVELPRLVREHFTEAGNIVISLVETSTKSLVSLIVFVVGVFTFLNDGPRLFAWCKAHAPIRAKHLDRIGAAYNETGRGLVIGVGATAVIQGLVATAVYIAIGLPRAVALGLITAFAALVPGLGTILVWGPIAALLAMGGHPAKAAIVVFAGVVVIGTIDHFLRPILSQKAHLQLTPIMLFLSMLGGILTFGTAGLVLGPLAIRVSIELLEIAREERMVGTPTKD